MIKGIGVDIVQIPRMEAILQQYQGDDLIKFLSRILHPNELTKFKTIDLKKKASFIAKRFAAKEAVAKSLGTGIGSPYAFNEIEIYNNEIGKPGVKIHHAQIEICNFEISISDDYPSAIAFVVRY